jgi:CHAD domain-containing protein
VTERTEPQWAQAIVDGLIASANDALQRYCARPKSAKRVHRLRKSLARAQAALEDFASLKLATAKITKRIARIHRCAGKVRDYDVLLKRLRGFESVREELRRRRRRSRRRLRHLTRRLNGRIA